MRKGTIDKARLLEIAAGFEATRIAVVGDIILDLFIYGTVERISPEAPVPIVRVAKEVHRLGGSSNVASNLTTLGVTTDLFGLIGNDQSGTVFTKILEFSGISPYGLTAVNGYHTITKTRIIAHHQQIVRFDKEMDFKPTKRTIDALIGKLESRLDDYDAIIVSDYGKGVVNPYLLGRIRELRERSGIFVALDPKISNYRHYKNFSLITPNRNEASEGSGIRIKDEKTIVAAAKKIVKDLSPEMLLITRSEDGMSLFDRTLDRIDIPTMARNVFDVTGAGDTVISVFTAAKAAGASNYEAAFLSNLAAGIVVGELGTYAIPYERFSAEIKEL